MRRRQLLTSLAFAGALVGLAVWAILAGRRQEPPAPTDVDESLAEADGHMDPAVELLLRESAKDDVEHESPFFKALTALAEKHGLSRKEYFPGRWLDGPEDGYATRVGTSRNAHVVVVLRYAEKIIPGRDTQHLLLLNAGGKVLDRLSCDINNRLTTCLADPGRYFAEVTDSPQQDGAQLVIRYVPEKGGSIPGNWSHEITHGATYSFHWGQAGRGHIRSDEWEEKGLCRVAIRDDKFAVIFPSLVPVPQR